MLDARLNSVHLESPRRQDFRAARERLLNARGGHTIAAERHPGGHSAVSEHNTAIQNGTDRSAETEARWVLRDADYTYPLKVGLNTVGRMPDNDVVLHDAFVSRRHCAVLIHLGGRCELHDVASKNGTYLNGEKIAGPTPLRSGDTIRLCGRQLVFLHYGDHPDDGPGYQPTRSD